MIYSITMLSLFGASSAMKRRPGDWRPEAAAPGRASRSRIRNASSHRGRESAPVRTPLRSHKGGLLERSRGSPSPTRADKSGPALTSRRNRPTLIRAPSPLPKTYKNSGLVGYSMKTSGVYYYSKSDERGFSYTEDSPCYKYTYEIADHLYETVQDGTNVRHKLKCDDFSKEIHKVAQAIFGSLKQKNGKYHDSRSPYEILNNPEYFYYGARSNPLIFNQPPNQLWTEVDFGTFPLFWPARIIMKKNNLMADQEGYLENCKRTLGHITVWKRDLEKGPNVQISDRNSNTVARSDLFQQVFARTGYEWFHKEVPGREKILPDTYIFGQQEVEDAVMRPVMILKILNPKEYVEPGKRASKTSSKSRATSPPPAQALTKSLAVEAAIAEEEEDVDMSMSSSSSWSAWEESTRHIMERTNFPATFGPHKEQNMLISTTNRDHSPSRKAPDGFDADHLLLGISESDFADFTIPFSENEPDFFASDHTEDEDIDEF